MGRKSRIDKKHECARQRADLILQVRNGQLTATEAAAILGVSRKTYYRWEKRGLEALVGALENRGTGGRPAQEVDPEKQKLEKRLAEIEKENQELRQTLAIKEALQGFFAPNNPGGKTRGKKRRSHNRGCENNDRS